MASEPHVALLRGINVGGRNIVPMSDLRSALGSSGLLDVRTYTCRPGTIKKHLALYEKMGKTPQTRHLGQPLAYLTTETGNVNQYIHIWVYESAGDRETKRAAMWADPEWIAYTVESGKLGALDSQENRLMTPVEFFPLKR